MIYAHSMATLVPIALPSSLDPLHHLPYNLNPNCEGDPYVIISCVILSSCNIPSLREICRD